MTEFFTKKQIDEIRECFNTYTIGNDTIRSATQLRCILRSLGYSTTTAKTLEYFKKHKKCIDFATFLEIAKEEHNAPDGLTEVIKALKALDRNGERAISENTLRGLLTNLGERLTHQEVDALFSTVAVNKMIPHQKLVQFISK
ncbi:hypothetical protein WR25_08239 [Diploscapter pachys]|uniref:EF-hand domain-containing protein n=1 Tax=Diploscapter pachys TaxID=2018661 RepID=A0A2A2LHD7_9BILA|nr:hypothetical protein WR25_08239 [Diploscapter pachys]